MDTLLIQICVSSSSDTGSEGSAQGRGEKGFCRGVPQGQGSFWEPPAARAGLRVLPGGSSAGRSPDVQSPDGSWTALMDPGTFQFLLSISAAHLGSGTPRLGGISRGNIYISPRGMDGFIYSDGLFRYYIYYTDIIYIIQILYMFRYSDYSDGLFRWIYLFGREEDRPGSSPEAGTGRSHPRQPPSRPPAPLPRPQTVLKQQLSACPANPSQVTSRQPTPLAKLSHSSAPR